jgi:hypothetical protein
MAADGEENGKYEHLDWPWENAIAALRTIYKAPEPWAWRSVMNILAFHVEREERLAAEWRAADRHRLRVVRGNSGREGRPQ